VVCYRFTGGLHAEYVCRSSEQCNGWLTLPEVEQSGAEASKILQMLCSQPSRECWRCCPCTIQLLLICYSIYACCRSLYNSKNGGRGGSWEAATALLFRMKIKAASRVRASCKTNTSFTRAVRILQHVLGQDC